jgi:hypothetical protein
MPRSKIADNIEGVVKYLLTKRYSYSMIRRELIKMNLNASRSTIYRISNNIGKQRQAGLSNDQKPKFPRRCHVATASVIHRITSFIDKENPPTISMMASRCAISVGTTVRIIREIIHAKCRKKRPVHRLYPGAIEKRRSRSWRMYRRLCNERWRNYVTTDEAWFYLDASQGVRDVYYIRSDGLPEEIRKIERNELHPVSVLVWAGVSARGKTRLHFMERGSTINSRYYIDQILKPFIEFDIPRLFPGDERKKLVFHQDSAPGHAAKQTIAFLKEQKVQVVTPDEWLPKSPDAAPMDYSIWGILKDRVRKHKVSTLNGLKNAIKQEWENLEQNVIEQVLETWPKRCRLIYYAHGSHIEHLLQ